MASNVVANCLDSASRKAKVHVENSEIVLDRFIEAAERMKQSDFLEGVEGIKECFKSLLGAQAALEAHSQAAVMLKQQYQEPSDNSETDFKVLLETATSQQQENFDPESHPQYLELMEQLRDVAPEEAAVDDEDDLHIQQGNNLAPNSRCPLSGKELLELEEPVQDSKGFVYEKKFVVDFVMNKPGGCANAPLAGAVHQIRTSDLRPARKVIHAQRRARNQPPQTQRADDEAILDVE